MKWQSALKGEERKKIVYDILNRNLAGRDKMMKSRKRTISNSLLLQGPFNISAGVTELSEEGYTVNYNWTKALAVGTR